MPRKKTTLREEPVMLEQRSSWEAEAPSSIKTTQPHAARGRRVFLIGRTKDWLARHDLTPTREAKPLSARVSGKAWGPILVALLAFAAYMANGRWMGTIDNYATRYVPLSIVREGNTDLDEFPGLLNADHARIGQAGDGHYYSRSPTALLAVPIYWMAEVLGFGPQTAVDVDQLAKLSAAVITALGVGVMALALSRFVTGWRLWLISAAYALGSPLWPVASQDLWSHTSAQFFSVLAIYCLVRGLNQPNWILVAMAPLGLTFLSRPQQVIAVIPIVVYMFIYYRRQFYWALLVALPSALVLLLFRPNLFSGFYANWAALGLGRFFRFDPRTILRVVGRQLFDPSHGLLVYSPYALFAVFGVVILVRGYRQPANRATGKRCPRLFLLFATIAAGYLLFYSSFIYWRGGWSLTNRYLSAATPYLAMLLVPVVGYRPMPKLLSGGLVVLVVLAVSVNGLVAFYADIEWLSQYLPRVQSTWNYTAPTSLLFYVGRKALGYGDGPILDEEGGLLSPEAYRASGNLIPTAPVEDPAESIHLREGWCAPESFGVWTCFGSNFPISPIGPLFGQGKAALVVHLEPGKDYTLRIRAQPYCDETHQSQTMQVRYNGHDVGEFSLPCRGSWEPYGFAAVVQSAWISG
jgi:hypothetical protein